MTDPSNHTRPEAIGTLIRRILDDGKTYVRAEVDIYRHKALAWVPPVRTAAILLVAALFLVQAAVTTLLVAIGFWLALWLGPVGGGIGAAMIGLAIAGLCAWIAIGKLKVAPSGANA